MKYHSYLRIVEGIFKLFLRMSRRYDSKTTTFTPDGRLQQIEYAIEAINKTGSSIGVLTQEGVILATEKYDVSFLLEESVISEKIYCIDKHLYTVVCGLAADANFLIDVLREQAQKYRLKFREPMPIEQLIVHICDIKQQYTQAGSSRPFGTAFLFAGYDKYNKFQLYSTDPSGNYAGWKATAIGNNNTAANSFLKQEYKEDFSLAQGLNLALKSLVKTMETTSPSSKKIELVTVTVINGEVVGKTLNDQEIKGLLKDNGMGENVMEEEK